MTTAGATDRRVHVRAPGKINIAFDVGDVQPDGYHDVASVYQAVSVYEDVWAQVADDFTVAVTGDLDVAGVPLDGTNLAVRAARRVADRLGWARGIHLDIHKGVPVAGGMGGGSADAAAALVAVNELLGGGLTALELQELGAPLGADGRRQHQRGGAVVRNASRTRVSRPYRQASRRRGSIIFARQWTCR